MKSQRDMAGFLNVDVKTLRNWRRDKPNLYEIVIKGFAFDEAIQVSKENYERLNSLANDISDEHSNAKK